MSPSLGKSHFSKDIGALGFNWETYSFCDCGDRHAQFDCRVLRAQVQSLVDHGIIWIETEAVRRKDCMEASLCLPST